MKFKFLLLSASYFLLIPSVAMSAPIRPVPQATVSATAPSADAYRNCQQAANAVVTLYSGLEIGSGSIIDADGTILTAQHVVKEAIAQPNKVKIYVKLANGKRYIGRAIGSDKRNDLALVQISAKEPLSTVPLASAATPPNGQQVCAIGSPSGKTGVLSRGTFKSLLGNGDLQSTLRLNYGNSGGPLLNPQGELIGVNKSVWLSERGENTGISFATGLQAAQPFIEKYHRLTTAVAKQPAPEVINPLIRPAPVAFSPISQSPQASQKRSTPDSLGVVFDAKNMMVQQVEFGSPADLGGLKPGDRLVAINGTQLNGLQQLQTFLSRQPSTAVLTINRNQQVANVQVNF
ncbi:MAG: S1C family serine protease [Stenomitos frigidus ULC029]